MRRALSLPSRMRHETELHMTDPGGHRHQRSTWFYANADDGFFIQQQFVVVEVTILVNW
jgi:hypothetical protein